jgi:hypothetical protein
MREIKLHTKVVNDLVVMRRVFLCLRQIKPDFRSALFNAALLLSNDMQQPLMSIPYLTQLLQVHDLL